MVGWTWSKHSKPRQWQQGTTLMEMARRTMPCGGLPRGSGISSPARLRATSSYSNGGRRETYQFGETSMAMGRRISPFGGPRPALGGSSPAATRALQSFDSGGCRETSLSPQITTEMVKLILLCGDPQMASGGSSHRRHLQLSPPPNGAPTAMCRSRNPLASEAIGTHNSSFEEPIMPNL